MPAGAFSVSSIQRVRPDCAGVAELSAASDGGDVNKIRVIMAICVLLYDDIFQLLEIYISIR